MERRNFLQGVVSLPIVPSIPSLESDTEEEYYEFSSAWMGDWSRMIIVKNGEIRHAFEYENYSAWEQATMINARWTADQSNVQTNYIADLFDLNLKGIYIDAPYFFARFENENSEVQIRQGKYSEPEYVYVVESHDDEALRGAEGGSDTIQGVVNEVAEVVKN